MHELGKSLFRQVVGKSIEELTRIPKGPETVRDYLKQQQSRFPLRILGWSSDGLVSLAEEERTHAHVIGLPGQGKSKFLELLICGDIDNLVAGRSQGGVCLIDSGDFGNTYYKVLKYCAQVGYEKVCIIDPNDLFDKRFGKVATINPIRYKAPVDVIVGSVLEIMRILWDGEDFSRTAKIQEYLQSIIALLHESQGTLYDAKYFTSRTNELYERKLNVLMSRIEYPQFNDAATTIKEAFGFNQSLFINDFGSTIRRLKPIFSKTLELMIGSNQSPISFQKMIRDGWIILANLDPQIWDVPQQKFLGTLIINELIHAAYRLRAADREVPFYLYIDEVGRYATRTLSDVINYKRTSRIQLVMAHQDFTQIKNAEVMAAVRNAGIKVMFHVERDDRDKIIRQIYGGDLPLDQVSYDLSTLKKQEAVIKIGKMPPRKTQLIDVPDVELSDARLTAFKQKLYEQPWYRTKKEIYDEINARFRTTKPVGPDGGGFDSHRDDSQGARKRSTGHPAPARRTDAPKPGRKTYFDT